ncbi:MAG TPA: hypothetical protein VGO11_05720 [Chthoniobacteraceae bacterium]|jgi:hypothetical protein|nr:hypothetical protein [Chthoniobacteraceae bacterium]
MIENPIQSRHSAEVKMHLRVGDLVLSIGQMGPDFLLLQKPVACPPCHARIWLSIDGREREWDVHLPNGIHEASRRVEIAAA